LIIKQVSASSAAAALAAALSGGKSSKEKKQGGASNTALWLKPGEIWVYIFDTALFSFDFRVLGIVVTLPWTGRERAPMFLLLKREINALKTKM
jgi:hypothetical protein